jgi:glyoxalase family protein
VHHVAWSVADDEAQRVVGEMVTTAGLAPTRVMDRSYFKSIYFNEPGGVLFEVATIPPGFAIDEPLERLGERLMLPPQYEPRRAELESVLPPIQMPVQAPSGAFFAGDTPATSTTSSPRSFS